MSKFYTMKVTSNLYEDLYLDYFGGLSFDKTYSGAIKEGMTDRLTNDYVKGFIEREAENKETFKVNNIKDLQVELIIEEADLTIFTRKVRDTMIAMPFTKEQIMSEYGIELENLQEEVKTIKSKIEDLEDDVIYIENDIASLKKKMNDVLGGE